MSIFFPFYSLFKEIGKGERIALARLAVEHLERCQRPLRIAIDAAIWNFQTQAGQGGKNPALRTLFYRLVKLLALPIHPVFVYDGRSKPLTKRGRTVARYGSCISNEVSKKVIQMFRFPCHVAVGEAEAECAMLQRKGVVDAVMSQDGDAIMFGSTVTLRNWSKEGSGHNKAPTHVDLLDSRRIMEWTGLDSEGMVLVAMLSGGDYDGDGVSGIGATLACEIARAGFGSDLLELVRKDDDDGIREWRERLQFELETNESGYFRKKRKAITIPETFPERKILGYYMNPAVTLEEDLPQLERRWMKVWKSEIDIPALRVFVGDTFEWLYKPGAWKFVRVMAPALLADRLQRGMDAHVRSADQITQRRTEFKSDGIPELRVTVVPAEVVGLDLDAEEDSPEYLERLQEEYEDVAEVDIREEGGSIPPSPAKKRRTPLWLPDAPEKMWIAEAIVERGAREHVETWHQIQSEIQSDPKKFATRKCPKTKEPRKPKATGGMQAGALLSFVVPSAITNDEKALDETSFEPPAPRAKANISVRRLPKTPTKPKTTRSANLSSPTMLGFFKSTKSSQPDQDPEERLELPENSSLNPFTAALSTTENGTKRGHKSLSEKHSRQLTSSSSEIVQHVVKKAIKVRQNQIRPLLDAPEHHPSSHIEVQSKSSIILKEVQNALSMGGSSREEAILIWSSPNPRDGESVEKKWNEPVDNNEPEDILSIVTQCTSRRPVKKDRPLPEHEPDTPRGSPTRVKRTIESFFAPYIASNKQRRGSGEVAQNKQPTDPAAIPHEFATGLTTGFSAARVHAIPRTSLPGTWKEVECESGSHSQLDPSGPSRAPRISIVDLTGS